MAQIESPQDSVLGKRPAEAFAPFERVDISSGTYFLNPVPLLEPDGTGAVFVTVEQNTLNKPATWRLDLASTTLVAIPTPLDISTPAGCVVKQHVAWDQDGKLCTLAIAFIDDDAEQCRLELRTVSGTHHSEFIEADLFQNSCVCTGRYAAFVCDPTGTEDIGVAIFDLATAALVHQTIFAEAYNMALSCAEDRILACSLPKAPTGDITVTEITLGTWTRTNHSFVGPRHTGGGCSFATTRDGSMLCVAYVNYEAKAFVVVGWNRDTQRVVHYTYPTRHLYELPFLKFSGNGAYVLAVFDTGYVVLEALTCKAVEECLFPSYTRDITCACSDNGTLVVQCPDEHWVRLYAIPSMHPRPPVLAATP
jgi:hypothetical protein